MTYEEIRDLIGQVLADASTLTAARNRDDFDAFTAEGSLLLEALADAAPTLARELQRLLAKHADGAWVFAADLRRALEGKKAVGNDPLVLQVQRLRMEYANLLADADASPHWRTRALRAEAALEEARTALRLATDPKPDDLLGARLVNGCASLPDDTPEWVALLLREAWTAIRALRRDAEGKAARIASLDEEVERLHAETEDLRLTLAAERGDPAGAPDPAWRWVGRGWERDYPDGELGAVLRDGRWYRGRVGQSARVLGEAASQRAGMIACDAAVSPLTIPCPTCDAPADERCRDLPPINIPDRDGNHDHVGRVLSEPHPARVAAAKRNT